MMKRMMLVFFFLISWTVYGQETLTVVAVGKAELQRDMISFSRIEADFLNAQQVLATKKLLKVLASDFDFYRNIFEIGSYHFKTLKESKGRYFVELKLSKNLSLNIRLFDRSQKKILWESTQKFSVQKVRDLAHSIAHEIYRVITGKASVFKSKILFVSDKGSSKNKKELYIMDFDGARKRRLTYLNSMVLAPAISPDNKKALFSVIESKRIRKRGKILRGVKNINLYEMNLETNKVRLISSEAGINSGAVYTKDGKSIYLTLSHLKNADIYKFNLATKAKSKVTSHYSDDVDPHVNFDESKLTFLSGRAGKAMIYTLDPSGREKRVKRISFVGKFNASPRFNPTGSEIVFSSWVDDKFDLYRIDSDGRNLVRLTKNFGSNEEPWFSPDGQFIVFTSQRVLTSDKAVQDMYIMNRDGEVIRKISENFGKIYTPRWSN